MRFNDKEIAQLSSSSDLEGILCHLKPTEGDWTDWYQQPTFKERYFRLKANLLFYSRMKSDPEPLGVLVLENSHISYESPHKGIPFAFSLKFKVNDKLRDNEAKHIFSCRCEADVNSWVTALKKASYEFLRSQCIILRTKLEMSTGKDPVLDYLKKKMTESVATRTTVKMKQTKKVTSTFYSHIQSNMLHEQESSSSFTSREMVSTSNHSNSQTENLISF